MIQYRCNIVSINDYRQHSLLSPARGLPGLPGPTPALTHQNRQPSPTPPHLSVRPPVLPSSLPPSLPSPAQPHFRSPLSSPLSSLPPPHTPPDAFRQLPCPHTPPHPLLSRQQQAATGRNRQQQAATGRNSASRYRLWRLRRLLCGVQVLPICFTLLNRRYRHISNF